jgi:DNA-binding NarL/FixJ family response regulator
MNWGSSSSPRAGTSTSGSERRGYLLNERVHDRAQLCPAIVTIARGGSTMDPEDRGAPRGGPGCGKRGIPLASLMVREHEVLAEIVQGESNSAIAESLVLTKPGVEKHINSIFLKLDLAFADDVSKRVKAR